MQVEQAAQLRRAVPRLKEVAAGKPGEHGDCDGYCHADVEAPSPAPGGERRCAHGHGGLLDWITVAEMLLSDTRVRQGSCAVPACRTIRPTSVVPSFPPAYL